MGALGSARPAVATPAAAAVMVAALSFAILAANLPGAEAAICGDGTDTGISGAGNSYYRMCDACPETSTGCESDDCTLMAER